VSDRKFKVLFIYPGIFMQIGLPLGIPCLVAVLKEKGIDSRVFDTIFYQEDTDAVDQNTDLAERLHQVKPVDYKSVGISKKSSSMEEDFVKLLLEYKPDLIGISLIECIFERGVKLTKLAKKVTDVPVVAGGVFPTVAPEIALKEDSIDIVCVGEGEGPLLELCERLQENKPYSDVKSLYIKEGDAIIKNKITPLKPLEDLSEPDFSGFDPKIFYRPMQGNLFKTIPIEFARGCPNQCTYCAAPSLNKLHRKEVDQRYFRVKPIKNVLKEMEKNIGLYSPEFFYFGSETFLAINDEVFNEFVNGYKKIKIPFWIQTRPETITYERIKKLKEIGLYWLTIGIEHGNEEYRKKYLKRYTTNRQIEEAVKLLDELGQGVSVNSIIGFPFETRELIYDTMELNRKLFKINKNVRCNLSIFVPFRGCELHDLCLSNKLIDDAPYTNHTCLSSGSPLKSGFLTHEEIDGLFRIFNLYVHLPDEYLDRVRLAEEFSPRGNNEFQVLSKIVEERIW